MLLPASRGSCGRARRLWQAALLALLLARLPVSAATFTVTNTLDSGAGSLRWAITNANALPDTDTVIFNIPGPGPHTISLASGFGNINNPVIVDGYTQPGASPNTLANGDNAVIKIRLSGAGVVTTGFQVNSSGCAIRGLSLIHFTSHAIHLGSFADTLVQGNFIGLDVDGSTIRTNGGVGVRTTAGNAIIGGTDPSDRNVISGNAGGGIEMFNSAGNVVQGNYIGTDAAGTQARGNKLFGIAIQNPNSVNNQVGGPSDAARNVIAATTGTGTNGNHGVYMNNAFNNSIEGNFIGTDRTGTNALGNAGAGVLLTNALNNIIGGTANGAGNVIAFNTSTGVRIPSGTNAVLANSIFANGGLGIDIGTVGVTANDAGDTDTGANNLQNFPVLTGVTNLIDQTVVHGTFNSRTGRTYRIGFFANPTNAPWGKTHLGAVLLTLGANATTNFVISLATDNLTGQFVTATATSTANETSEFATNRAVISLQPPSIIAPPTNATVDAGANAAFAVNAAGTPPLRYQWLRNGAPLPNATNASLTLANVQMADAGSYVVFVTNAYGAITTGPVMLALVPLGSVSVLVVSNLADVGVGSFRQAILNANANAGLRTIAFNLPGSGPFSLVPATPLPVITNAVVIDGTSQPGFADVPLIELNGGNAGAAADGLTITADGCTVRGLVVNRFAGRGIFLKGGGSNTIAGNYVGTDRSGALALPNGSGIQIEGSFNIIGGTNTGARNIVSGNNGVGMLITNSMSFGNVVQGNFVGLRASGTTALGNGSIGILVRGGARNNTIGGSLPGAGNVISANGVAAVNGMDGIDLLDSGTTGNVIQGNFVGTDATGKAAMGNLDAGIGIMLGASSNLIGGASAGARNVIADSGAGGVKPGLHDGIYLEGTNTAGNVIQGNYIGTDVTGTNALRNLHNGVRLWDGPHDNLIGGTDGGSGNLIANHAGAGIFLDNTFSGQAPLRNAMLGNSIFANASLAIDLGPSGAATNDLNDVDAGPNNHQNYPVLTAATNNGFGTFIKGLLNSSPNDTYRIEFFVSPVSAREARTLLATMNATTDGSGNANFTASVTSGNLMTQFITATATDSLGNTSEVSPSLAPSSNGAPIIVSQPIGQTVWFGTNATLSVVVVGPGQLYYQWARNGTNLVNATKPLLDIASVTLADAGSYTVTVSNSFGTVVSQSGVLTVRAEPVITFAPYSRTDPIGSTVQFLVEARGAPPLFYRWLFGGTPILNATNATLVVTNVQYGNAGSYSVVVSNTAGAVSSQPAFLSVVPAVVQTWVARYNGPVNSGDGARALTVDDVGNVYVTGLSVGSASGADYLTVKYAVTGEFLWAAIYNGPGNGGDYANSIAVDAAGNVYVTGESAGPGTGLDYATVKYDAAGVQQWVARYAGPTNASDSAVKVALDGSGNVLVTGTSGGDVATVKYGANGLQLWAARYNGPANGPDQGRDLAVDRDGNAYVTGGVTGLTNAQDYATFKYGPGGALLWMATYSGPGPQNDLAYALALDGSGNAIVTGVSPGAGTGPDYATLKYDHTGTPVWVRRYNAPASKRDEAYALALDGAGQAHLTGFVTANGNQFDYGTVKYDTSGNLLWAAFYGGPTNDVARAVAVDCAGNVCVTGYASNGTNNDLATIQYDANGNVRWQARYDNGGLDEAAALAVDRYGNILVAGRSSNGANEDLVVVKYAQVGYPAIAMQPQDASAPLGGVASLSVAASSTRELFYQWRRDGTNIPGATNTILAFDTLTLADSGIYSVCISNAIGAVLSREARLVVLPPQPPSIVAQPQSQMVAVGATVTLAVTVSGTGTFSFQWFRNGVSLAGETNATLTLAGVQVEDSGSYAVVIFGPLGATRSAPALIEIGVPSLAMTNNFAEQVTLTAASGSGRARNTNTTSEAGEPAHAGKAGGRSMWMSWLAPGSGIATFSTAGSSFDTLLAVYTGSVLTNLVEVASDDDDSGFYTSTVTFNAHAGTLYRIAVDGLNGAAGSMVVRWNLEPTMETEPGIVAQPQSQTLASGNSATFTVMADSTNITFQWFFNGAPISEATSNVLFLPSVTEPLTGRYWARLTRGGRARDTRPALLQINATGAGTQNVRTADKLADANDAHHRLRLDAGPAGGDFSPAGLSLGYSGSQVFDSSGSSVEASEPVHCSTPGGASQWFTYLANANGTLILTTDGSSFDTILAVYTGSGADFNRLQAVACDDNSGLDGRDSKVTFQVVSNTFYYIAVDGVRGATGKARLNYNLVVPARLTALGMTAQGDCQIRISGQSGRSLLIEHSADLATWQTLATTNAPGSAFDFVDSNAHAVTHRFYRVVTLP